VISELATDCTVFVSFGNGGSAGIRRSSNGASQFKLEGSSQISLAEITGRLPVILIGPDALLLMDEGSKPRRALLDWGTFHVEHGFYAIWLRYQRALKQRNSLLRSSNISRASLYVWDREIGDSASYLHKLRAEYLTKLIPVWFETSRYLLPGLALSLEYSPGWDISRKLDAKLAENFERDIDRGHTQEGAHRADLKIKWNDIPADQVLSRGQMKLAIHALKLSQAIVLENIGKRALVLVDDFTSELDKTAQDRLLQCLFNGRSQAFITAIEPEPLIKAAERLGETVKLFHVEHGTVKETPVL
jgi:DNA replication and repair protein RecF